MGECRAALLSELDSGLVGLGIFGARPSHISAIAADELDLDFWRYLRHEDGGPDAQLARDKCVRQPGVPA
ncbi:hypothetical protein GCM10027053_29160 [Intrasporangium mesophilum]